MKSRAELRQIALVIAEDAEQDVMRREGQPFTGANVAAALGEMCAQIRALASIVAELTTEGE